MKSLLDQEYATVLVSAKENLANAENAIKHWSLGPKDVDAPNDKYWSDIAEARSVSPEMARNQICANCEYYDNTAQVLFDMAKKYSLNKLDIYNSPQQRGYCTKLDFACHTTRTCLSWEGKDFNAD